MTNSFRKQNKTDVRGFQLWSGNDFSQIVIPFLRFDLSMISAQTCSADVAKENRSPALRIML